MRIVIETHVGGRYSARVVDRHGRVEAACSHRHRDRELAVECGRRLRRRAAKRLATP